MNEKLRWIAYHLNQFEQWKIKAILRSFLATRMLYGKIPHLNRKDLILLPLNNPLAVKYILFYIGIKPYLINSLIQYLYDRNE